MLSLGTVQLGLDSALPHPRGHPSRAEALAILDAALAGGVNTFDTAWAYGEAEDILGEWITTRKLVGRVNIISKTKPHVLNDYPDGTKASAIIQAEIEKSLRRLKVEQLDGYLLHSQHYIYRERGVAGLQQVKPAGWVKNSGVSIYDESEALQAAELAVDYIQIPYNIFDRRLEATTFFELTKKNGVTVFARSPFLQGLLTMAPAKIPDRLAHARPVVETFEKISKKHRLPRAASALGFSYLHPLINHVVFGVDTVAQLKENLATTDQLPAGINECVAEIRQGFQQISRSIILPSLWTKLATSKK